MEIASNIHQDVLRYRISATSQGESSRVDKILHGEDVCMSHPCEYTLSTNFSGPSYTISVTAENIIGLGEPLTCTPNHISMISINIKKSIIE